MEIKNLNNRMISAYKSVTGNPAKGKSAPAEKTGGDNFDKVEFDFDRSIGAAKTDITASVAADAEAGRIGSLQADYEGDKLPVTPKQIAETIVG